MISVIPESILDQELDEELGYLKHDYQNKHTDNNCETVSYFVYD